MNQITNWSLEDAVEINLEHEDDFLKVKETLERIGVSSFKEKKLWQTAHILHKRGKYYILHFKCLFALDGKTALFSTDDWKRQNRIAKLLEDWGLCTIVNPDNLGDMEDINKIKILKYSEKENWTLISKYNIGN